MIKIKVCKLSDIINRSIWCIASFLVIWASLYFALELMQPFSFTLIKRCIQNDLGTQPKKSTLEELIYLTLPIQDLTVQRAIENDIELVDNETVEDVGDGDIAITENVQEQKLENSIEDENNDKKNLQPISLLECEKVSDSKYLIGNVTVNDYTSKDLDLEALEKSMFVTVPDDCKVLIYHTHTSESYYGVSSSSSSFHTSDPQYNVVRVGEELKNRLNQYGIQVRQDTSVHDSPSYNGAYKSSLNTVENILKNENYDIIIDIHRDALASNTQYRPTAEIEGETVAKLMFVVGTNTAGLKHDNWIENLKFAIAFVQISNEMYPGLFRGIHLSTSRYNQHTSDKTLILEVGATGNTLEEACLSMKYFAKVLNTMRKR